MASEKVTAMIEEIKALSVLELSELVHALEETFGVSAAAVAAPAAAVAPGVVTAGGEHAESQDRSAQGGKTPSSHSHGCSSLSTRA